MASWIKRTTINIPNVSPAILVNLLISAHALKVASRNKKIAVQTQTLKKKKKKGKRFQLSKHTHTHIYIS